MSTQRPPTSLTDEQLEAVAHHMMMSQTMQTVAYMAHDLPIDLDDKDSLRAAIATTTWELIQAMDAGRIHFDEINDRAMFHGLLTVAMEVMFDGRLKDHLMVSPGLQ